MTHHNVSTTEELIAHMSEAGYHLWRRPRGFEVLFDLPEAHESSIGVGVSWVPTRDVVRFIVGLPVSFPASRRPEMDALVARLNRALPLPCLVTLDAGAGIVTHAFLDAGGAISTAVVERNVRMCLDVAKAHVVELQRVATGAP